MSMSRRDRWVVNLTTLGLAALGVADIVIAVGAQVHAPQPAAAASGVISTPAVAGRHRHSPARNRHPALPASAPTAIDIPAIGVRSPLSRLGLNPDGSVQVPASYQQAGWYDRSVTPGEAGPSVILGHVDSQRGPGIFFRLGALRPGDRVRVRRADGRTVSFVISGVRRYAKDDFPTAAVYGGTGTPTIRLITCGGTFDHATGHYTANIVAFGQLANR